MSIPGHTKDSLLRILHEQLSPSGPVQSIEHLYGRELQLREIDKALSSTGRQVFVYGDRGVGKTSLAQSAAYAHQSSDSDPILIGCNRSTVFHDIVETIARKVQKADPAIKETATKTRKLKGLGLEIGSDTKYERAEVTAPKNFNEAVELIGTFVPRHSSKVLVVIDEFDLLAETEKAIFADLIKQIGDQKIPVQFVFCGIGESLDELLGAHGSSYRYVEGVEVERLRFDARLDIILQSSAALGVEVPEPQRFRIAAISDGFPHYVHLICEKIYWELFYDEAEVRTSTKAHYTSAIGAAINGIQQQLRRAYDKATIKDTDENHFILWAAADHPNLMRHKEDIYESYVTIMSRLGEEPLDFKAFSRQLSHLTSPSCGAILRRQSDDARSYYQFAESIVRGYVRLRAEEQGISLATEHSEHSEGRVTARPRKLYRPVAGWRRMYKKLR